MKISELLNNKWEWARDIEVKYDADVDIQHCDVSFAPIAEDWVGTTEAAIDSNSMEVFKTRENSVLNYPSYAKYMNEVFGYEVYNTKEEKAN